jgi:hypothetical protein
MTQKIMTKHPQGLQGVNIDQAKYEQMREAIVASLDERNPLTFKQLSQAVKQKLEDRFDGSIGWYCTTVKLDLEARGVIECLRQGRGGQKIRLLAS